MSAKKATGGSDKRTGATASGFTAEERAAMRERAKELKAAIDAWRKTPDGKEERERHEKILRLRALKAKRAAMEAQREPPG